VPRKIHSRISLAACCLGFVAAAHASPTTLTLDAAVRLAAERAPRLDACDQILNERLGRLRVGHLSLLVGRCENGISIIV
jgi:hypothetical protein